LTSSVFNNGDEDLAIGWFTALKIIPWGDVLEAAPHIVKGAKRLFTATMNGASDAPDIAPIPASAPSERDQIENLDNRVRHIQAKVDELVAEQKSSAELIASLAEQNARVVEAIEVLRIRTKVLIVVCVLFGAALSALALWVVVK
jgi:hypothetical protein